MAQDVRQEWDVIGITAADSTKVSDMRISDTSSIDKSVTAVVNISFLVN